MTSSTKPTILVVSDDSYMRRRLRKLAAHEMFVVVEATSATAALDVLSHRHLDAIVVDADALHGDACVFLDRSCVRQDIPALILSMRADDAFKAALFDAGAADYVIKPFSSVELIARLKAHIKRMSHRVFSGGDVIVFGDICVDLARRFVTHKTNKVELTPIEYRLLARLASHPNHIFTHEELLTSIWGPRDEIDPHYLRAHMRNLRKKIETIPSEPQHLKTQPGVGYFFAP